MNTLDAGPSNIIPQLVLIILLTAINSFFASAEMAIVSVNKNKIKKLSEDGNKKAKLLLKLLDEPSDFLSAIQIGITLAGFFSSASAATGISGYVYNLISNYNIPFAKEICMILITIILSYFTLVFGELVPKRIALKKAESIALVSVSTIHAVSIVTKPFIKILSLSTKLVLKIIGSDDKEIEEKVSEEEIRSIITKSQQDGCIEFEEKEMINGIFEFNDRAAKEIMISRKDTFMIDIGENSQEIIDKIIDINYSRIPVYEDNIDNIIGVVYVRDLLKKARKYGFENIEIRRILQNPCFVPETIKTDDLFKFLKENKTHMALLLDEYGGFSGIVTMEDLVEEVMGEIQDEYDIEVPRIKKIEDNSYIVRGIIPIHDFSNRFNINIEDGEYDTLSGYLLTAFGVIPKEGDKISINNVEYLIVKVDNRRIEQVNVKILGRILEAI